MDELDQGRVAYAEHAWLLAHKSLSQADHTRSLTAADLEMLGWSAYMIGRYDELVEALERAHHAHLRDGAVPNAIRGAFWLGVTSALRGRMGPAGGWLGRAGRLLGREERDSVERGYLLLPEVLRQRQEGEVAAACEAAERAVEIGARFADADLRALAMHEQGRALILRGRMSDGFALLDESMVAVTAGELSPVVTGLIYCSVIEACQQVHASRRAREWTDALSDWCEREPNMVSFSGTCLTLRAEIMRTHGQWRQALTEAQHACERFAQGSDRSAAAPAYYQRAEIHRLRGEFEDAEDNYREAGRCGVEPQPGLALLRLAQSNEVAALAAIRRTLGEAHEPVERAGILPAYGEITLAAGRLEWAAESCTELARLAEHFDSGVLRAAAAQLRGAVRLTEGAVLSALDSLRPAQRLWQELEMPYEAARGRVLLGMAGRALGDDDMARFEFESARETFEWLGARPELVRLTTRTARVAGHDNDRGLTERELAVLRLIATGDSNREIAAALSISEHTVARHVQNIFAKLGVSSRTAAGAFAFEHHLLDAPG